MREIKFRVFVKHLGQLADVLTIDFLEREVEIYLVDRDEVRYYPLDEDEIVLLQFTGLKDKNGKEIYELDIVSYFGLKYEVLFKNGAFGWMEDGEFYSFNEMARSEFNKFEIIGNVYENPELLEGTV